MDKETKRRIDARIVDHIEAGELNEAAEVAIAEYGPSIFGMFMGVFHDEANAQDAFQRFSLQLWKSLPSFQGRSQFYTWAFTIARRSMSRMFERPELRVEQRLGTLQERNLQARWTRTATAEWRNTESRDRFEEMCAALDPEERTLVMLRIGQEMSWKEIAAVTADEAEALDKKALSRRAASLRKRFERVKNTMREAMARPSGEG